MAADSLKYAHSHEWIESSGATRRVGITDFAQKQLGDIVFVELPDVGKTVNAGDELCVIESTKATASVYAPAAGTVAEINGSLVDHPERINSDPLSEGWLIALSDVTETQELMDLDVYESFCKEEEEH